MTPLFTRWHRVLILMSLVLSQLALADDTEIFGVTNQNQGVNLLLVVDTSGSMDSDVYLNSNSYDMNTRYEGGYIPDLLYHTVNDARLTGHRKNTLDSSCAPYANALEQNGFLEGMVTETCSTCDVNSLLHYFGSQFKCGEGTGNVYLGNYLNWLSNGGRYKTDRISVVETAVNDILDSVENINVGLMRFDEGADEGGMVDVPVGPVNVSGPLISNALAKYKEDPEGETPLEETFYEAGLYFKGEEWHFGKEAKPNPSVPASRVSSARYRSPITQSCQSNAIILLTDGLPSSDNSANTLIKKKIEGFDLPDGLNKNCVGFGQCMDEWAWYLRNEDQSSLPGKQTISTYTIGGFDLDMGDALLQPVAHQGQGSHHNANNPTELTNVLNNIITQAFDQPTSFSAPAVSVNAFNGTRHQDDLFFALFQPKNGIRWEGNLRRYKLKDGVLVGKDGTTPVVDPVTGAFTKDSRDIWDDNNTDDGEDVTQGGFAGRLNPETRQILSNTSSNQLASFDEVATAQTLNMLDASDSEVLNTKNWFRGYDVDDQDFDQDHDEPRGAIGDPLHTEPVVVTYGGSQHNPKATVFFGTNEGVIHAVNANTGEEQFAFAPTELHSNIHQYRTNSGSAQERPYGMDGPISILMRDLNRNNVVYANGTSVEPGEYVNLYAGMRRGGRNYYALDVTRPTSPTLKFVIRGGEGDYARLAQTWAKPTVAKIKMGTQERIVLVIAGGYDPAADDRTEREDDSIGNAIYIVDAETGQRLWWASRSGANLNIPDMKNSVPSGVTAVDVTGDGLLNYLFFADIGGRIFRVDFNPRATNANSLAKGGIIADFGGADNIQFFNRPNVSLIKDKQYGDALAIAIGSGDRTRPVTDVSTSNRFYMIKDYSPYQAPVEYDQRQIYSGSVSTLNALTLSKRNWILDGNDLLTEGRDGFTNEVKRAFDQAGGWFIDLDYTGEKSLSESTTFAGAILFTTFAPLINSNDTVCGSNLGRSRFFAVQQKYPMAALDLNGDGEVDEDDSSRIVKHAGIAPKPVVVYRQGGKKSIAIGTEIVEDPRFNDLDPTGAGNDDQNQCESHNCYVTPVYWRQNFGK